jgi:hypothetical protein
VSTARLFLSGIRATGNHGARPGEKDEAQPFVVDLDLEVDVGDDQIGGTADSGITEAARAIAEPSFIESWPPRSRTDPGRSASCAHRCRPQAERRRTAGIDGAAAATAPNG